tara:strand:+ start:503 stop:1495 length:993 start_codon:yes stop_codon:yes gene_type:complete
MKLTTNILENLIKETLVEILNEDPLAKFRSSLEAPKDNTYVPPRAGGVTIHNKSGRKGPDLPNNWPTTNIKDFPVGSPERKAEYDRRNWKYDDTISTESIEEDNVMHIHPPGTPEHKKIIDTSFPEPEFNWDTMKKRTDIYPKDRHTTPVRADTLHTPSGMTIHHTFDEPFKTDADGTPLTYHRLKKLDHTGHEYEGGDGYIDQAYADERQQTFIDKNKLKAHDWKFDADKARADRIDFITKSGKYTEGKTPNYKQMMGVQNLTEGKRRELEIHVMDKLKVDKILKKLRLKPGKHYDIGAGSRQSFVLDVDVKFLDKLITFLMKNRVRVR